MKLSSLFSNNFSKLFKNCDQKEIVYSLQNIFLSPTLYIEITFAIFILYGKIPFQNDLLHIKVNVS